MKPLFFSSYGNVHFQDNKEVVESNDILYPEENNSFPNLVYSIRDKKT